MTGADTHPLVAQVEALVEGLSDHERALIGKIFAREPGLIHDDSGAGVEKRLDPVFACYHVVTMHEMRRAHSKGIHGRIIGEGQICLLAKIIHGMAVNGARGQERETALSIMREVVDCVMASFASGVSNEVETVDLRDGGGLA